METLTESSLSCRLSPPAQNSRVPVTMNMKVLALPAAAVSGLGYATGALGLPAAAVAFVAVLGITVLSFLD